MCCVGEFELFIFLNFWERKSVITRVHLWCVCVWGGPVVTVLHSDRENIRNVENVVKIITTNPDFFFFMWLLCGELKVILERLWFDECVGREMSSAVIHSLE